MVLTDQEKELVEKFFATCDTSNSGYIDDEHAKQSTRLLKLIEGVRFHTKGSSKGKVYLSDLMDYYARLKEGKIENGRNSNEDIYENVLSMMMSRVLRFQKGPSYDESD